MPSDLARYGEVIEIVEPKAKLRVDRSSIAEVLSSVLANHSVEDVSVEDPPLEEVIAEMFALTSKEFSDRESPQPLASSS
jgi:ABC-2 type transport system ATP-binding protein